MMPRNLDELRLHMAYSQRPEPAEHDYTPPESQDCNGANSNSMWSQSHGSHQQRWNRPPASPPTHEADSVHKGSNAPPNHHKENYNCFFGNQKGHFSQDRTGYKHDNTGRYNAPARSVSQDWTCSQPPLRKRTGFPTSQSPSGDNTQTHYSQVQSQQLPQHMHSRARITAESYMIPIESSQSDRLQSCNMHGFETNQLKQQGFSQPKKGSWSVPLTSEGGAFVSSSALDDGTGEPKKYIYGSQIVARPIPHGVGSASRPHQSYSQSCSTQAETVTSTQRANSCATPKVQEATNLERLKQNLERIHQGGGARYLEPYMRLIGVLHHEDYKYQKYMDTRPDNTIKAKYWIKCVYCSSNRVYRTKDPLRRHMESNACSWNPKIHRESQVVSNISGSICSQSQTQRESCTTIFSESISGPPPRICDGQSQPNPVNKNTISAAPPPAFQLASSQSQSSIISATHRFTRPETIIASQNGIQRVPLFGGFPLPVPLKIIHSSSYGPPAAAGTKPTEIKATETQTAEIRKDEIRNEQHDSPHLSAVSSCLDELSLEQLLGRLSQYDIQMLLQKSGSDSVTAQTRFRPSLMQNTADGNATQNSEAVPALLTRQHAVIHQERRAKAAAADAGIIGTPQCLIDDSDVIHKVAAAETHAKSWQQEGQYRQIRAAENVAAARGTKRIKRKSGLTTVPPAAAAIAVSTLATVAATPAAKPRPGRPRPTHRSIGVQTKLGSVYLEEALLLYAADCKQKKKKPCGNAQNITTERKPKVSVEKKGKIKAETREGNKKEDMTKDVDEPQQPVPERKTVKQKKETKAEDNNIVIDIPMKRSRRLTCLKQEREDESEVLRQQSIDMPLLLVGAPLSIKNPQTETWEACTVGPYCPLAQTHEVTFSCSRVKRLRLWESELRTNK